MSYYKLIILLAMFVLNLPISNAETIYIHVEEDCLDRYEYVLNGNKEGDVFVSYHAKLGKNKSVILEVEKENRKWTKEKPRNLLSCNSLALNKRLVQKINNEETKIFMVRSTDSHYNLTTVKKAIFYEQVAQTIELSSRDADFVFSLRNLVSGIDIAMPNSEMDVYLEGTVTSQCTKGYIIRRSNGFTSKSFKEWTLVPEIGIVEKRAYSTNKRGSQNKNIFKLDKINHLDYQDYLGEICTELQANIIDNKTPNTSRPKSYDDEVSSYSTELKDPRVNLNTSPSKVIIQMFKELDHVVSLLKMEFILSKKDKHYGVLHVNMAFLLGKSKAGIA